ncbi:GNAT family N-acetyltransferase [Streptomyces cadmiisoli]|uniref:GNAT family N-acetyltransferase n=1 Tax=Streptomyces cadmiisoli TaxID=2184053 RepID=UPI003D749AE5
MTSLNDPLGPVVLAYTGVRHALAASGHFRRDADGTVLAVSGAPVASLNAVISPNPDPSPEVIGKLAGSEYLQGLAWSIQVRGVPGPQVIEVAAGHGLTSVSGLPLMVRRPGAGEPARAGGGLRVRPVDGDELGLYAGIMSDGFGVPHEAFAMFAEPALARTEGFTFYLAELDGVPVGTGMAAVTGDLLGVFNIAVLPEYRRRGHGLAVTTEIVRAGYAAGATTAYLYASPWGESVYTTAGFRTEEVLAMFTAPV